MKYAFLRDNPDGTWNAVIVGNVVDGRGEVLDALFDKSKEEIDLWVRNQIGPSKTVYRQQ